jgi:MoxR-like ATPase
MNWDYAGTQRFNPAIMNRINSWLDVDYLPQAQEAALIVERTGIDKQVANHMCIFARKVRAAAQKENLPDLSTRILLNWASIIKEGMNPAEAAELSVIPILGYTEEEKEMPRELLNTIFGTKKFEED